MKNYREHTLEAIAQIIGLDEFDDQYQSNIHDDGKISLADDLLVFFHRNYRRGNILDIGCGSGSIFNVICEITHAIEPNERRRLTARNLVLMRSLNIEVIEGWAENIPHTSGYFDTVLSWGTICFVRSILETFYEVNRVLKLNGVFIFDIVEKSNLPIVQTVDPDSFIKWVELFGFALLERRDLKSYAPHLRLALAFKKIAEFDSSQFRMPQCLGKINNYSQSRDWYL